MLHFKQKGCHRAGYLWKDVFSVVPPPGKDKNLAGMQPQVWTLKTSKKTTRYREPQKRILEETFSIGHWEDGPQTRCSSRCTDELQKKRSGKSTLCCRWVPEAPTSAKLFLQNGCKAQEQTRRRYHWRRNNSCWRRRSLLADSRNCYWPVPGSWHSTCVFCMRRMVSETWASPSYAAQWANISIWRRQHLKIPQGALHNVFKQPSRGALFQRNEIQGRTPSPLTPQSPGGRNLVICQNFKPKAYLCFNYIILAVGWYISFEILSFRY